MPTPKPYQDQSRLEDAIRIQLHYQHAGLKKVITGKDLTDALKSNGFPSLSQRQLRLTIRDMRRQGIPICSKAGYGYFWPRSIEDVQACRAVEFDSKAKDMLVTDKAMMNGAIVLFGSQGSLGI